ncbi:polysaccharide deacetylase family protein [Halobacillus rhizosphaerae]|uniref:polysaccharide deacetylase family protein n=1 Tax=Halobacillus rhizosphaerae TaxID=3064889 RepID=UPI00398B7604
MKEPIIYLSLLSVLLLSACSFIATANENNAKKSAPSHFKVSMETEVEQFEGYQLTIHYPQTPDSQINQTIIDYVNQKKASFKKQSFQTSVKQNNHEIHELNINFEVLYENASVFVVRFSEKLHMEKQKEVTQTIMNFDKENGKRLELDQIFQKDKEYYDLLSSQVQTEVLEKARVDDADLTAKIKAELSPKADLYKNTALTGDSLTVYFNQGQLPKQVSIQKVKLNDKKLMNLVKEKYLQQGEPAEKSKEVAAKEEQPLNEDVKAEYRSEADKKIALTFNDGPHPKVTRRILGTLKSYHAKATFFMIGQRVKYYPEIAREVAEQGNQIGNHTWDHSRADYLTSKELKKELEKTQRIIQQTTGQTPTVVRYPFGGVPAEKQDDQLRRAPFTITVDDWQLENSEVIAKEVIAKAKDHSVIMLHDLYPSTADAVEQIVRTLTKKGYSFVTLDELQNRRVK